MERKGLIFNSKILKQFRDIFSIKLMNNADYYLQCQEILRNAMSKLGFPLPEDKICEISELITDTMGGINRYFHNFEHLLMFADHEDPMIIIAGLFHDLVYVQVDRNIPFNLTAYLTPFIQEKSGCFLIKSYPQSDSKYLEIALDIFGLNFGDNLSNFRGQNEFLSALCTAQILDVHLPLSMIVRLMTIIELTIPFRAKENNLTPPEQLEIRLRKVNQKFQLNLSESEIIFTINEGVKLANLDVSGFAVKNVKDFLQNTWLLLPETNHFLHQQCLYTIKELVVALIKTSKFISSLYPEIIFHHYHNYPPQTDYNLLIQNSKFNLDITRYYFLYQIISLGILQGLINRFTTSLSLSFFFPSRCEVLDNYSSLIHFLPRVNFPKFSSDSQEFQIINLLSYRFEIPPFPYDDLGNFVIFIVHNLTLNNTITLIDQCYLFFDNKIDHNLFLKQFPDDLINTIADAIAVFLETKRKQL